MPTFRSRDTQQRGDGGSDIGKTESGILPQRAAAAEDERHGIEGVRRTDTHGAILLRVVHLVGVAVVSGDKQCIAQLPG